MNRKTQFLFLTAVILFSGILYAQEKASDFPVLKGPYLGQKPPGLKPVLFAPDIFDKEVHGGLVFSSDGREAYWDLMEEGRNILFIRIENGKWTEPAEVPFKSKYGTGDAAFSPDGNRLFFTSQESIEGGRKEPDENIWFVEREDGCWGKPRPLDLVVNAYPLHWQLSVAANGNLYFGARGDIYVAVPRDGEYTSVNEVSGSINTEHYESTPFIAPDERYLIFSRYGGDLHYADLFISYMDQKGNWTKPVNMGPEINSDMHELCPNVTADGQYLFFNRNHGEEGDLRIFWVDAKIIRDLNNTREYSK